MGKFEQANTPTYHTQTLRVAQTGLRSPSKEQGLDYRPRPFTGTSLLTNGKKYDCQKYHVTRAAEYIGGKIVLLTPGAQNA